MDFMQELEQKTRHADSVVCSYLPAEEGPDRTLLEAMNYSVRAGGKRLRPLMIESTFRMYGGRSRIVDPFMAAMEMIHTHSLVHDDLPAMDNDEYRRGKKTTHAVYGEAMAILAGDGLLNLGYETAAGAFRLCGITAPGSLQAGIHRSDTGSSEEAGTDAARDAVRVARALQILAVKTGINGMLGGQSVDVELDGQPLLEDQLAYIYGYKTGALIEGSLMIGAALAGAEDEEIRKLEKIGRDVGDAFQIRDDILDVTSTTEEIGKPVGSDAKNCKTTYVTIHGIEDSEAEVKRLSERAITIFDSLEAEDPFLRQLLLSLIDRRK